MRGRPFHPPATVEGAIFGGMSDDRIQTSVVFGPAWLTGKDSSTYNPELAQFCALLCAGSYFRAKDSPTDPNDSVTLTAGHQTVGGKYDVYAVVVRGCFMKTPRRSAADISSSTAT